MKHCPTCKRTYSGETISFCLEGGSLLSADRDGKATEPPPTIGYESSGKTLTATPPTVPPEWRAYPPPTMPSPVGQIARPSNHSRLIHFSIALAILLVGGSVAGCFKGQTPSPSTPPSGRIAPPVAVSEGERLAMYSKPAVVRIYVGPEGTFVYRHLNGEVRSYPGFQHVISGSGFFISSNGYIATNAHVTRMWHEGEDKAREFLINRFIAAAGKTFYSIAENNMTRAQYNGIRERIVGLSNFNMYHVVVTPDGSQLIFEDKPSGYGAPTEESENAKDVAVIKIEVKNAPVLLLGDSDKVKVSDTDAVIGYPGVADFDEFKGFRSAKSPLEAAFTFGHISATKSLASGAILQTDANIDHGNSGGPVLNAEGEVIGLATFGKDSQHSFVVTSNTAKEFVNAVGATNELGLTDKLYREGLELYWQGKYKEAMPKFEEVKRLFPQHSEVNGLIQKSQQAIAEGRTSRVSQSGWQVISYWSFYSSRPFSLSLSCCSC